jgi:hypothetical protein
MSEKMNVGMEKIYFKYMLENPDQFSKVEPHFFKNEDIRFVYHIIREEFLLSKKKIVPSNKQIFALTRLHAEQRDIPKETLQILLVHKNDKFDEDEFILPRFKAWKLSNNVKNHVMKEIEMMRGLDEIDYDNVREIVAKIKNMSSEIDIIDNDDEDLGEDFDDPESHRQDETIQKIPTGFDCLDTILNGGWDYASLNVLLGETNVGKCHSFPSSLTLRRKSDNKEIKMSVGDLFLIYKNRK